MDCIAEFAGISKTYDGRTQVVAGLDLKIASGEFLTLLGPSGSGKTTALMMLAGFEVPTGGEIMLDGKSLTRLPPHRRNIGMVFQNYALFPHMTVGENVAFPLQVRGIGKSEVENRVKRALDMVRLPQVASRRPGQLSGGQQQRIALARALVFEPRLVLMDEPLGALDKQLREHMQYEIRSLHARLGVTIVYVTHDQSEALTMSDRIAVFSHGRVRQLASPIAVYEEATDGFVATFVGESNSFTGRMGSGGGPFVRVDVPELGGITALAVDATAESGVSVVVRPEHVTIGAEADDLINRFTGKIKDIVYHGDHLRIHILDRRNEEIVARRGKKDADKLRIGDDLTFGFDPKSARAYSLAKAMH